MFLVDNDFKKKFGDIYLKSCFKQCSYMYTNKQSGFNLKKRYICECIIITTGTPSNVYKVFDYYFFNCNERRKFF